jgi:nuclear transcription Y subunit beta
MNSNNNINKHVEFDRYLPIANISRIIKTNLPSEVKLSKEAKETFQECVSEFISFVTSEASDICISEKRKTINGDDLIQALSKLGFERYKNTLRVYLDKYRESTKNNTITSNLVGNSNNIIDNESKSIENNNEFNDNKIDVNNNNNKDNINYKEMRALFDRFKKEGNQLN